MEYAIRLAANSVLQNKIGHLLKRRWVRVPHEVQVQGWKPGRVVAKGEWHPGKGFFELVQELNGRVDLVVLLALEPHKRLGDKCPSAKARCAIAALGSYLPTPLAETPQPSRRQ